MSKHPSQEKYEKAKARHKQRAQEIEKRIQEDLYALRREFIPKYLKRKLLTGFAVFATVYLAEELVFRKKVPGIFKFTGALAATFMAPKMYSFLQENYLVADENSTSGEVGTLPPQPEAPVTETKAREDEGLKDEFPETE